jgi:hypothetical protein
MLWPDNYPVHFDAEIHPYICHLYAYRGRGAYSCLCQHGQWVAILAQIILPDTCLLAGSFLHSSTAKLACVLYVLVLVLGAIRSMLFSFGGHEAIGCPQDVGSER